MILAIRTDKPEAELYLIKKTTVVKEEKWLAHRKLADTILDKISALVASYNTGLESLEGIVVFTGEGSFTGLRIGTAVANALAYSQAIPVVTASGKNWLEEGIGKLATAKPGKSVSPIYHSQPNISTPKKPILEDRSK